MNLHLFPSIPMPPSHKLIISIEIDTYPSAQDLPEAYRQLLDRAKLAAERAYAPYSNFLVGATLLLENGTTVEGNNQENAAYPSGICAERNAFYWAGANSPAMRIEAVAVVAKRRGEAAFIPVTPCGACRQAMLEYETRQQADIKVIMEGHNGSILVVPSVGSLLPLKFEEKSLKG